jgi:hypothetical protein
MYKPDVFFFNSINKHFKISSVPVIVIVVSGCRSNLERMGWESDIIALRVLTF